MTIFDAALRYQSEGIPLLVIAGKEYGSGSSRDWAAKGPALLGVRAVIAESFERIHRSNLIGMGVLPLQFSPSENAQSLGLTGRESMDVTGLTGASLGDLVGRELTVLADGRSFPVTLRVDTPGEAEYLWHGGILPFVVRALAKD
jgi:aconitate hydratase